MTAQQRQLAMLAILLFVWAIAWNTLGADPPQRVSLVNVSGLAKGTKLATDGGRTSNEGLRVHLELLTASRAERAASSSASKNIFELHRSEPSLTEPGPTPPPVAASDEPPPAIEAPPAPSAWAELAEFRYLGYLELGNPGHGRREVALLAKRDVLHTVKRGETIGIGILVTAITPTTVTLRHLASRVEQQLVLADGAP